MTAPGALTNVVTASDGSGSATNVTVSGMGTGTNDRVTVIAVDGDVSGSLTVSTSGFTVIGPYLGPSSFFTMGVAYKAASTDDSVEWTWSGGQQYAVMGSQSPDTNFATDPLAVNTNAAATSVANNITMPSVAWTPTDRDVRIISVACANDGRKPWDTWPDPDNNLAITSGGAGYPDLGIATGGYTASSPQSPGTFQHPNPGTDNWAQGFVMKEPAAAGSLVVAQRRVINRTLFAR